MYLISSFVVEPLRSLPTKRTMENVLPSSVANIDHTVVLSYILSGHRRVSSDAPDLRDDEDPAQPTHGQVYLATSIGPEDVTEDVQVKDIFLTSEGGIETSVSPSSTYRSFDTADSGGRMIKSCQTPPNHIPLPPISPRKIILAVMTHLRSMNLRACTGLQARAPLRFIPLRDFLVLIGIGRQ